MKRVLFILTIPSPYRVTFFNELGKHTELTVLFERKSADYRDKSWDNNVFNNFQGIFLPGINCSSNSAFCPGVIKYLKRHSEFDCIIICNLSTPTGILAIQYLRIKRIKYYIEIDGGFAKNGKGLKELFKTHIIKNAAGYFSTSKNADEYLLMYGAKSGLIHRYPFTSIKKSDTDRPFLISYEDQKYIKGILNVKETIVIIGLERILKEEGYNRFGEFISALEKESEVRICIIKEFAENEVIKSSIYRKNVTFISSADKNIDLWFSIADVYYEINRDEETNTFLRKAHLFGVPIIQNGLDKDSYRVCISDEIECGNNSHINITIHDIYNGLFNKDRLDEIRHKNLISIRKMVSEETESTRVTWLEGTYRINKEISKSKIGIDPDKFVVIFVGSFIYRKGVDILLKAWSGVDHAQLIIVGGNPTEEYLKIVSDENVKNITWVPFVEKSKIDMYFMAADIMAFPTREDIWGLVVNEALGYGLPTITTNACAAGVEMITHNKNGFIINANDYKTLEEKINHLRNVDINRYRINCLAIASKYTIEEMVNAHMKEIETC